MVVRALWVEWLWGALWDGCESVVGALWNGCECFESVVEGCESVVEWL